ncbi:hypothetical protein CDAR_525241 [Caerostris darwini]|uniref:Uncharacterized protein n=1 Tax=Caerostris darwini TaxID=1538125 RepID=A0AAV4SHA0_9ARAC|nr:hypothetical protein CDAR_525241 [Caerostris darwini]
MNTGHKRFRQINIKESFALNKKPKLETTSNMEQNLRDLMATAAEKRYFETNYLTWAPCDAVCTYDTVALIGNNKVFKRIALHMVFNHCSIHRYALVAKDRDEELHNILQDIVIVISYFKSHSLSRLI